MKKLGPNGEARSEWRSYVLMEKLGPNGEARS